MSQSEKEKQLEQLEKEFKENEEKLLGPTYEYWKKIRTPREMGMSDHGSLSVTARDIGGLIEYVKLMVSGGGRASKPGKPLGNKFFLPTNTKCFKRGTSDENGNLSEVDRYTYISHVPRGQIPFISSGMGVNFSTFKGQIPGAMQNLEAINPANFWRAMKTNGKPLCMPIEMETRDNNDNIKMEIKHVPVIEVKSMDACLFPGKRNPETGEACRETFTNLNNDNDDLLLQFYIGTVSLLGLYLVYNMGKKLY
uniref:Uncharacterized protein n=1 Tax=viral metagenome TaxID=1070528 RepID=A0A6C0BTA6_9ZZZZ